MSEQAEGQANLAPIRIAVTTTALFDVKEEHDVYLNEGLTNYLDMQEGRRDTPMKEGVLFNFLKAIENVNKKANEALGVKGKLIEVMIMSHNSGAMGPRISKSIEHHDLGIGIMCLTDGESPVKFLDAYQVDLFLTSFKNGEVEDAIKKGFAAAYLDYQLVETASTDQLKIAFDLDAVLFTDESERVYQSQGLEAFLQHEKEKSDQICNEGPFAKFGRKVAQIQGAFTEKGFKSENNPIRIFVVTARGGAHPSKRAFNTLIEWGIDKNQMHMLNGNKKGPILDVIRPHIFFDDGEKHIVGAKEVGIPAGHVKYDKSPVQSQNDA